ncbi:hypothetical protein ACLOJK_023116 [Asimina triloba]
MENSANAIERLNFKVNQLVAYNEMLDSQNLPQEPKFDQEILIENSFNALKQQDEVIKRLTYQVDQLVTYNEMLDSQNLQQESFSNEILGELHSQSESNLDEHCEVITLGSEKQGEDQLDCGNHMEVTNEIEAPNAVKCVSLMEEAEKVEQELPKSCIPIIPYTPPSVFLNEENVPQVEPQTFPHSTRSKSRYTVYNDPPEHGAPVRCSIIFPNPAHLHLFSNAGHPYRPNQQHPASLPPEPAAARLHRPPPSAISSIRSNTARRPSASPSNRPPRLLCPSTDPMPTAADPHSNPAPRTHPADNNSPIKSPLSFFSNAGKPSTHLHHAHEQNPSRPNQAGSPHFSHFPRAPLWSSRLHFRSPFNPATNGSPHHPSIAPTTHASSTRCPCQAPPLHLIRPHSISKPSRPSRGPPHTTAMS